MEGARPASKKCRTVGARSVRSSRLAGPAGGPEVAETVGMAAGLPLEPWTERQTNGRVKEHQLGGWL